MLLGWLSGGLQKTWLCQAADAIRSTEIDRPADTLACAQNRQQQRPRGNALALYFRALFARPVLSKSKEDAQWEC
jgi:hypothetical protein